MVCCPLIHESVLCAREENTYFFLLRGGTLSMHHTQHSNNQQRTTTLLSLSSPQSELMSLMFSSTRIWISRWMMDLGSWIVIRNAMPCLRLVRSVALCINREEWITMHRMRGGAHCILLVHRPFIEQQSARFPSSGISGLTTQRGRGSGFMNRGLGFLDLAEVMSLGSRE